MSQENVELSCRVTDAFNRHDPEAMVALCDPKCEWLPAIEAEVEGEPVVYQATTVCGSTSRTKRSRSWSTDSTCPNAGISAREYCCRVGLCARSWERSGASFDLAALVEWRDGKCVRVVAYRDHAEALEAVGLSEQEAHADS